MKLALRQGLRERLVIGTANILLGLLVPGELSVNDGVAKREQVPQHMGMNGIARRKGTRHMGTSALVGQNPEIEFGKEASEVGEGSIWWGGKGFDPERGAYFNRIFLEERVRILVFVFLAVVELEVVRRFQR